MISHSESKGPLESHIAPANTKPERLSEYARDLFQCLPSRKSVKKAIKSGRLRVDGHPSATGHWVKPGEELTVVEGPIFPRRYELKLEVLYEDEHLAVVYKPGDIPTSGNAFRTLSNALSYNLLPSSEPDALRIPVPVHRLDRMTAGPVLTAKTYRAAKDLGDMFARREVKKYYLALVGGEVRAAVRMDDDLEGKSALTEAEPLSLGSHPILGAWSCLSIRPETGRRHQIRLHLSAAGHPVCGDPLYGGASVGRGLMLCAYRLVFTHPRTGVRVDVDCPPPKKFIPFLPEGI